MVARRLVTAIIVLAMCLHSARVIHACGPSSIDPIFVFTESPDLPFDKYVRGNLGIVQPSFGRKTLFIAYRYLNGGWFDSEEQTALVEALHGKAPEDDGTTAVKAWIAARKEIGIKEEKPPEIYTERQYGGYDFFPNCAKNGFEVATATLKDRAAKFGSDDPAVRAWLSAQDIVFQNCQEGGVLPPEVGPAGPTWLRKDRDYQIAAALFYSMDFEAAKARFQKVAADGDSPWQQIAEYLLPRTLVRQASLTDDERKNLELYDQAESRLNILAARKGSLSDAARKMLALIHYRVRPEERVRELAKTLSHDSGNQNLRQDLIDYVWLLDKLEDRILQAEAARKKAEAERDQKAEPEPPINDQQISEKAKELRENYEAVQRGELISLTFIPNLGGSNPDYSNMIWLFFKPETTQPEIIRQFESRSGRALTPAEQEGLKNSYQQAMKSRTYLISANRKFDRTLAEAHEGCAYGCETLTLDLMPDFFKADDLTDWILTIQTSDVTAYDHAWSKWRTTQSPAWLVATLISADESSPRLERLFRDAEKVDRRSPAFPTILYDVVRLKIGLGKDAEARKLLDQLLASNFEELPVSARNQFLEQRMKLAENVNDFLKFAQRKVVAFNDGGSLGSMHELLEIAKGRWNPEYYEESKEKFEQQTEIDFQKLLPWDNRLILDDDTVEILNWHFPLQELEQASRNPVLPDYQRRRFVQAVWTRAIVLHNYEVAARVAPEVVKLAPEMQPVFSSYLDARTDKEKERAALFVLLKFPSLSPLVVGGVPQIESTEEPDYYFETAWWCTPSNMEYSLKQEREVQRTVAKPLFLSSQTLELARKERAAIIDIGNGKSYLGKRVIAWANEEPADPRIPEALFIAAQANRSYKYDCNGWSNDQETQAEAGKLLLTRYPQSSWAAKLAQLENQ